jgi:hypothetical protein
MLKIGANIADLSGFEKMAECEKKPLQCWLQRFSLILR